MSFPFVYLSEIASPITRPISVLPGVSYRTIGVKWWGEGAYERETIDGSQTAAKTLSLVYEGDLIINKIWVRHGSTAIASKSVDGCTASGEFPTFELDRTKVLPSWIHWQTKSPVFWSICDALSHGTSGKNCIRPELFLTIQIPLPPLSQQRRIVALIEELAARIEVARGLRREAVEEVEIMHRHIYELIWLEANKSSLSLSLLEQVADVIDPQPDHRTPAEIIGGMPYVSIANISIDGKVDVLGARKVSPIAIERQESSFTIKTGDIVLGKIGTIGAARSIIVDQRFALSANVVLVQPNRSKILDKFLLALLRSPQIEEQIVGGTRLTAQGAFGIKKMRKLFIPLPPLAEQYHFVNHLDNLQTKVDSLKQLQSETSAELDALLPSVLDRAFKGEL